MRQQYNENECWGLGKEEGLMSKVEGVKFFCEKKGKRRKYEYWVLWWGELFSFFIEG